MKNLLYSVQANAARIYYREGRGDMALSYTRIEKIEATGRTTCAACNERIAKGVPALRFGVDFRGSGSWTIQMVTIHLEACQAVKPGISVYNW